MNHSRKYQEGINSVFFIGNYPPRQCGIATFTRDLLTAISIEAGGIQCAAAVMNDLPEGYNYPEEVRFEINQNRLSDYKKAADFLNINQVDMVCLQHEYGIFGGQAGSNIIHLLGNLRMPVVTTLHTVLKESDSERESVLKKIIELSDRLIVMSEKAKEFLIDIHNAPAEKVVIIPHGIPDVPFIDPNYYKDQFGVEGKKVILTFGLLSPNKGIEYMIRALPGIIKYHPEVIYIILGATHPHVLRSNGEEYRLYLQKIAKDLLVSDYIIFQNRFVKLEELCEFLGTADIYVTPYLYEEQVVSGTLAYALGTGNAVVSTPYWYAEEMLADGRGILVPFRDSETLSEVINSLLDNEIQRNAMRKNGYLYSRSAVWKEVARSYLKVFAEVKNERVSKPRAVFSLKKKGIACQFELPEIKLDHIISMTDDTGMLQHAVYTVPDRIHGYCTDDNARALMAVSIARSLMLSEEGLISGLCSRYLSFLNYAFNDENFRFRNFMNYDRAWIEEEGSEDSHGRSIWGLGVAVSNIEDPGILGISTRLFTKALAYSEKFNSVRSIAFALIGINNYLKVFSGDSEVKRIRDILTNRLMYLFKIKAKPDWPWCEDVLTYANAKLPQALILSGSETGSHDMVGTGLNSLEWLFDIQHRENHFVPIGNISWYKKGSEPSRFDQQPIEAQAMIDACIEAYAVTEDSGWIDRALVCFNWFLGHNDLGVSLYNPRTGGCRDGLTPNGVNENEGAESTLAWLLSLLTMHKLNSDNILDFWYKEGIRPGIETNRARLNN